MGNLPKYGVNNYHKRTKKKDQVVMRKYVQNEYQKEKKLEVKANR